MEQRFKCPNCTRELDDRAVAAQACPYCFTVFGTTATSSATAIPEEVFSRGSSVEMEAVSDPPNSAANVIPEEMLSRGSGALIDEDPLPERLHSAVSEIPERLIERRGAMEWANAQPIAPEAKPKPRPAQMGPPRHLKPKQEPRRLWPWILGLLVTAIVGAAVALYFLRG